MRRNNWYYVGLELIWWVFTGLVAFIVIYPVRLSIPDYPFLQSNLLFILTFITLTRYIFLLRFTFLARLRYIKMILIFLSIPFVFFLIQELNLFQVYLDEEGIDSIVGHLAYRQRSDMIDYIRSEMLLFGVGSIISGILFPFRLLLSVWRGYNRGTV